MKKSITMIAAAMMAMDAWAAGEVTDLTYDNALQLYWDGGVSPSDGRLEIGGWNGIRWANLNLEGKDYGEVVFTFGEGLPANLSFEVYYVGDDAGSAKTQVDPDEGATTVTLPFDEAKTVNTVYIKTRDNAATIALVKGVVHPRGTTGVPTVTLTADGKRGAIYTLGGQRLEKPTKGVCIIDGRKVVVK